MLHTTISISSVRGFDRTAMVSKVLTAWTSELLQQNAIVSGRTQRPTLSFVLSTCRPLPQVKRRHPFLKTALHQEIAQRRTIPVLARSPRSLPKIRRLIWSLMPMLFSPFAPTLTRRAPALVKSKAIKDQRRIGWNGRLFQGLSPSSSWLEAVAHPLVVSPRYALLLLAQQSIC